MNVPTAFNRLCSYFHEDIGADSSDPKEWIAFALGHLNAVEKVVVKTFLDELLKKSPDEKELQQIWFSTGADICFPNDGDLRGILRLIRDSIG
jgi:hypothetical protein